MKTVHITNTEVDYLARVAAASLVETLRGGSRFRTKDPIMAYAVPRGGIPAAYAIGRHINLKLVETPDKAEVFIDDLIDSGETMRAMLKDNPNKPFITLIDKHLLSVDHPHKGWIVFPWEGDSVGSFEDNIRRMLQFVGEDVTRGGLLETPARVAKAWEHWAGGYKIDPASVLKDFTDGAENVNEMVVIKDIPFFSHCVVGSTFVETPKGRIPISRLNDGDWIYTMDPITFEMSIVRCQNPRVTQKDAELVQVHTDNSSLICTPDHKILLTTGEWKEAQNLKNNDRLASLYRGASAFNDYTKLIYPSLMSNRYTRFKGGVKFLGACRSVVEHRFVGEFFNGPLPNDRTIVHHHVNELVWRNNPENLERVTHAEHNRRHQRTQKLATNINRKRAAASASGREEVRAKRSASVKAYWDNIKKDPNRYAERCLETAIGIMAAPRNHVVFGVEKLNYKEDVWCMNVPKTKLFFANGIAVHNCEHHMAPFFGKATVAYIPDGRIVGLSKINRLVDVFARRLQVQERLTTQVADALNDGLKPKGVGVIIAARHLCVESRGIKHQGCSTTTSALRGVFLDSTVRAEFLTLANRQSGMQCY